MDDAELTFDDLIKRMAELREYVTARREEKQIFDKGYKIWADQEKALFESLANIRKNKDEADAKRQANNKEISKTEFEINQLERELERKRQLELEKNIFAEAVKEIELATAGAPWREWAYPHQILGAQKLAMVKRGFLGDKMGLGKTLTSLIWADMVGAKRVLVFAPKEVLNNFQREIKHWAKHRILINLVSQPKFTRDLMLSAIRTSKASQFIILINLEAWRRDEQLIEDLISIKPDTVIIDEAHAVKSMSSVSFKGIKKIVYANNDCPKCGHGEFGIRSIIPPGGNFTKRAWACNNSECDLITWDQTDICSVKHVLPMTGTPILNKPQELFPLLNLIDKRTYSRETDFLYDFCTQDPFTKRWQFRRGGIEALTKKIGNQFVMRDRQSAGIIIPPQEIQYHNLNFSKHTHPEQWRAYIQLAQHAAVLLESDKVLTVPAFIALLTRFRQMMTWPAGIELKDENGIPMFRCEVKQSVKLEKAEELAKELIESGEKVVLFSQFKKPLQELQRRLNGYQFPDSEKVISSVTLDGETPEHIRESIKDDFDATTNTSHDKYDIVLANYRVGGVSLNFTAAAQMIVLDQEWNPGKRDQAYARIDRMGQTRDTTVHVISAASEELANHGIFQIDQFMAELMEQKENIVEGFEEQTRNNAAKMLDMLRKTIEEG